jgi:hypothetical protein
MGREATSLERLLDQRGNRQQARTMLAAAIHS